jgi:Nitroreductase family
MDMTVMDLKEAIYTRRSVRAFTADPVDEKTLTELIDAAIPPKRDQSAALLVLRCAR